jgi:hypothetical protein
MKASGACTNTKSITDGIELQNKSYIEQVNDHEQIQAQTDENRVGAFGIGGLYFVPSEHNKPPNRFQTKPGT